MEKISTSRVALLPRAANLATLAVVVAATWWSGAQRPLEQPVMAATQTTAAASVAQPLRQASELSTASTTQASWPVQATTLSRDSMQAVGFQTRTQR